MGAKYIKMTQNIFLFIIFMVNGGAVRQQEQAWDAEQRLDEALV